jgi:hypothetical protein
MSGATISQNGNQPNNGSTPRSGGTSTTNATPQASQIRSTATIGREWPEATSAFMMFSVARVPQIVSMRFLTA